MTVHAQSVATPEQLLDVFNSRTLQRLLTTAGLYTLSHEAISPLQYLACQRFIVNQIAIEAVRHLLEGDCLDRPIPLRPRGGA